MPVMANQAIGERVVRIGDRDYLLRPTYRALAEIEGQVGSHLETIRRLARRDFRLKDFVAILAAGMRAGADGREIPNDDAIGAALIERGLTTYADDVAGVLAPIFEGTRRMPADEKKDAAPSEPAPPATTGSTGGDT